MGEGCELEVEAGIVHKHKRVGPEFGYGLLAAFMLWKIFPRFLIT